jgi:hypothetical protein
MIVATNFCRNIGRRWQIERVSPSPLIPDDLVLTAHCNEFDHGISADVVGQHSDVTKIRSLM